MIELIKNFGNIESKIPVYNTAPVNPSTDDIYIVKQDGMYVGLNKVVEHIASGSTKKIGEVKLFYGNTAPNDWLFLDGQTILYDSYSEFCETLWPNTYGSGDFINIPDFRECVLQCVTTGRNPLDIIPGGILNHTHTWSESHSHTLTVGSHTHTTTATVATGYNNMRTNTQATGINRVSSTVTTLPYSRYTTTVKDESNMNWTLWYTWSGTSNSPSTTITWDTNGTGPVRANEIGINLIVRVK